MKNASEWLKLMLFSPYTMLLGSSVSLVPVAVNVKCIATLVVGCSLCVGRRNSV